MKGKTTRTRPRTARRIVAALLVLSWLAAIPGISSAAPGDRDRRISEFREKVAAARAELNALSGRAEMLDEEYLQARIALDEAGGRLAAARQTSRSARTDALRTQRILTERVRAAYVGAGSSLDLLLGSATYGEFADRVEFLDQIAQADADAVALAQVAGRRSVWAASGMASAVEERQRAVDALAQKRAAVKAAVADQEAMLAGLEEELRIALIPPPPPDPPEPPPIEPAPVEVPTEEPAPEPTEEPTQEPTEEPTEEPVEEGVEEAVEVEPVEQPAPNPAPPPPAPSSRVAAVLEAAYSQIGVPWVFAGDSPEGGFDCSGFTMWSWAHGGVSLPHSSAMQYDVLPHVDRSELQQGDLLFFYSPIHHVAIYVGGGRMIHSPGSGRTVTEQSVYWEYYVGAARPG